MRLRCHASNVSGVTIVANSRNSRRPSIRAFAASLRRWVVGEAQPPRSELFTEDTVLFLKIVDDLALLPVDPTSEGDQDKLQWMRQRRHAGQPIRC